MLHPRQMLPSLSNGPNSDSETGGDFMAGHASQGIGVAIFLTGFVVMAAGMALSGNLLLILLGIAVIAVSGAVLRKTRHEESTL